MIEHVSRYKVLASGIFCLILTMSIGRFAYTALLPTMFEQTQLDKVMAGWLATINYIGYMCGALAAFLISKLTLKDRLYRLGLVLTILTTAMMGWSESMWLWGLSRFIAGFATATGLLMGAGLMLNWLMRHHYRSEIGIHFSGVGIGIVLIALIAEFFQHLEWSSLWYLLAGLGVLLAIPSWCWLPKPDESGLTMEGQSLKDTPPSRRFVALMMFVYFCGGFGFVISATYIVAIIEGQSALSGYGNLAFLLLGLVASPACVFWDWVTRSMGILNALLLAYVVHAVGIVLPALSGGFWFAIASAVLWGMTFVGIVSIVLTMAGRFYPTKPSKLMGLLTMSYGVPQIIGPTIAGYLAVAYGNYSSALVMASAFVVLGVIAILAIKRWSNEDLSLLTM